MAKKRNYTANLQVSSKTEHYQWFEVILMLAELENKWQTKHWSLKMWLTTKMHELVHMKSLP